MNRRGGSWGPLEYVLLIILIALIIFTVLSLFWPALTLFYETNLK
jgi:Flp pilus assembly pilin Flp